MIERFAEEENSWFELECGGGICKVCDSLFFHELSLYLLNYDNLYALNYLTSFGLGMGEPSNAK